MMELAFHRLKCIKEHPVVHQAFTIIAIGVWIRTIVSIARVGAAGDRIVNKALWLDRYVGILAAMFPRQNSSGFIVTLEIISCPVFALHRSTAGGHNLESY